MDFPWLRNALQEESEVVHKQVSYRKQVVYFCQLPIFWSNWIRFKIKVEMQSFFQKSYPNLGDATPNQPINQWICNQKIPVGGRGSHQELDRRVWRHGSSSLAAMDAGGGSHYFPRLKSRVGMVVSFEESFFGEKQGVFCLKLSCRFIGVLTLLYLTQKLLIERFFSKDHSPWQALFFQEEEARARAMDLFFSFCEKISEGIKFGQDCIMRANAHGKPKGMTGDSSKSKAYLLSLARKVQNSHFWFASTKLLAGYAVLSFQTLVVYVDPDQDFLSMDCLTPFHRHSLLVSIFIARTDDHHDVRRMATLLWKEKLQSGPKAKAFDCMQSTGRVCDEFHLHIISMGSDVAKLTTFPNCG